MEAQRDDDDASIFCPLPQASKVYTIPEGCHGIQVCCMTRALSMSYWPACCTLDSLCAGAQRLQSWVIVMLTRPCEFDQWHDERHRAMSHVHDDLKQACYVAGRPATAVRLHAPRLTSRCPQERLQAHCGLSPQSVALASGFLFSANSQPSAGFGVGYSMCIPEVLTPSLQ